MNGLWFRLRIPALGLMLVAAGLVPVRVSALPIYADAWLDPCPCSCQAQCTASASGAGETSLSQGNFRETVPVATSHAGMGGTPGLTMAYNTYNADGTRATVDSVAGYGWTHSYNIFLFQQRSQMFRYDGDGRVTQYQYQPGGGYLSDKGYFENLVANGDGSFTLTQKDQTEFRFEQVSGTLFQVFGPVWRLVKLTDRVGNITALTYAGGLLTKVTDTYGRTLTFGYNAQNKLSSVADPLGRVTTFSYDATGRKLTQITDPLGKTITYTYNTLYQITKKVDQDGRVFTYQYSGQYPSGIRDGTAQSFFSLANPSQWGIDSGASALSLDRTFVPSTTTRTDGRGNLWRYDYDTRGYVTQMTAPDGSATTYAYDPATLRVNSVTDANLHTTTYAYDALGNRILITDPLLNQTQYTYEPAHNFEATRTDSSGRVTTYDYDAVGNRIRETQAVGLPEERTRTWAYDSHGNLVSAVDWRGYQTTYTYDANGFQTSMTEAVGQPEQRTTQYAYDAVGNLVTVTDALGRVVTTGYDDLNRVIAVTDALGQVSTNQYDNHGNLIKVTDRDLHSTQYRYDDRSRLIQTTDALGKREAYTYDGNGNRLTSADKNSHTNSSAYDVQNRLVTMTDALGFETRYQYDPVGNRLCVIDARGYETCYTYDALNRRVTATAADGGVTTSFYATTGPMCCSPTLGSSLLTSQTDANGKVTCYKYDSLDRLTRVVRKQGDVDCDVEDGDDAITITTYDAASNRLTVREPDLNTTIYQYDSLNRLVREVNAALDTTQYAYDAVGNRLVTVTPDGNTITYTYDALNRVTNIVDSVGVVRTNSYDPEGNQLTDTDGNGHTTHYKYDAINRLVQVTDPLGKPTTTAYDAVGNVLSVKDREGHSTTNAYDAVNRRVSTTDALLLRTTYQYDQVGNLTTITDAKPAPLTGVTSYEYDGVNRLVRETYPRGPADTRTYTYDFVGNVTSRTDQKGQTTTYQYSDLYFLLQRGYPTGPADTFTYDLSGRMLTAERNGWVVTYAYDGANRLLQSTQGGRVISYNYDIPGHTRTLTYPGGRALIETTDYRGRLSNVKDLLSTPAIATYAYDSANRVVTRDYKNGTRATYVYNNDNWISSLQHTHGPTLLAGFVYDYDQEGHKIYEQNNQNAVQSQAFQYDATYRLTDHRAGKLVGTGIPAPASHTSYDLDPLANWKHKTTDSVVETRTHDAANEITQIDATAILSDANGNLSQDQSYSYDYDEENRLITVTRLADSRLVGQYAYDALGCRIAKVADAGVISSPVETVYFYDGVRVIEEQDSGGTTTATYVYGNYVDEFLTLDQGGQVFYYHANHLHSIAAISGATGAVVERYQYDGYGERTVLAPNGTTVLAASADGNQIGFTGRYVDEETDLIYFRQRMYSAEQGRFTSRDFVREQYAAPAAGDGYGDGMNLYAAYYVPNGVDPLGANAWNPALDGAWRPNPAGIGDGIPGYSVRITFTVPANLPYQPASVRQANHAVAILLNSKCELKTEEDYIIDLPGRFNPGDTVHDHLAYRPVGDYCFIYRVVEKHIGIGPQGRLFQGRNDKASYDLMMRNMQEPKGDVVYSYLYMNQGKCKCCDLVSRLVGALGGNRERLSIPGVGTWSETFR